MNFLKEVESEYKDYIFESSLCLILLSSGENQNVIRSCRFFHDDLLG
jgi:hypothetical protein